MANIQVFHTTNIILSDTTRFTFIRSIPESMLRNVPAASEVLQDYRSLQVSGPIPMTEEIRKVLDKDDKPKKGVNARRRLVHPNLPRHQRRK